MQQSFSISFFCTMHMNKTFQTILSLKLLQNRKCEMLKRDVLGCSFWNITTVKLWLLVTFRYFTHSDCKIIIFFKESRITVTLFHISHYLKIFKLLQMLLFPPYPHNIPFSNVSTIFFITYMSIKSTKFFKT